MAEKKDLKLQNEALENVFAENITAEKVGIKSLNAGKVDLKKSGVGYLKAVNVTQENCGNALVRTRNLKTNDLKSLVVIADNIEGDVKTVLDKKGAAVFALVFASFCMLFRILRKLAR